MDKISIIVPVYNCEKYIKRCIDSLLKQTYQNIEIIIINDGSTDQTLNICNELSKKSKKVKVITQKNLGVSFARNKGIESSTGDYFTFCDADDYYDEDKIELQYKNAITNNSDLSIIGISLVFEDGSTKTRFDSGQTYIWKNNKEPLKYLLTDQVFPYAQYALLVKRSTLGNIRFDESKRINEDRLYCFDLLMSSSIITYSDVSKYNYVQLQGSATHGDFSDKYFDMINVSKLINNVIREEHPELLTYSKYNTLKSYITVTKYLLSDKKSLPLYREKLFTLITEIKKFGVPFIKQHFKGVRFIEVILIISLPKLYSMIILKIKKLKEVIG